MRITFQIGTCLVVTFALLFGFQNCGAPQEPDDSSTDVSAKALSEEVSQLYENIESLSNSNQHCSSDADCDSLALGAKACGGPTGYVVVSKLHPSLSQLNAMATELQQKETQLNQASDAISDCSLMMPPQVSCVASVCQATD